MLEESKLIKAIQNSWSDKTSSDEKNWSKENPAYGQCAVTSLVVNDYLGGEIVWASVKMPDANESSHYFNLIDGQEKDYTKAQFPSGTIIPKGIPKTKGYPSTREYILSFQQTRERYNLLKKRVEDMLIKI
jgi:hypothetical protein